MTNWIGEVFTSDMGWQHLEALVDTGNRMAGTPGEHEAAELTRDALAAVGARNAHLERFDLQGWDRDDSMLQAGGGTHDCIALPRSPTGTVESKLIDIGYGLPADFEESALEGKIVMVDSSVPDWADRYIHRREKYYRAVEAGCVAFIYRNHVEGCLPPTGHVRSDEQSIGDVPAIGVSAETGARLSRRWERTPVTISVDATLYNTTSQNVHAELGPATNEQVIVMSHVDAHDIATGAMDNGMGTALVIEIARALVDREDDLDTRVQFLVCGAEEVGSVGSGHHASNTDLDTVKAILNNDGLRGRDLTFTTHGFEALADTVKAVAEEFDHPVETVPKQDPHSDHWSFVQWGVPAYYVNSRSGNTGRRWGHTEADTLEKLDSRDLREQTVILTELVVQLAAAETEIPHRTTAEIAAALEEEDKAEGMKIIGDWPY